MIVEFEAPVWRWEARTELWTFVTLPPEESEVIRDVMADHDSRGFGAVRVQASIGMTSWRTSIFPDRQGYVLPIKRLVREAEGLAVGGLVQVHVDVLDL